MKLKVNLKKIIEKKVLLIGDFFLDEFLYGDSERLSPEAPVPVIKPSQSIFSLGGAGNVLSNLNNLGIKIIPVGILGIDPVSIQIFKYLKEKRVNSKNFIIDRKYTAIKKKRIILKNQHIARIDYEKINLQIALKHEKKIKNKILNLIRKTDLLIISDYGKGTLTDNIIKFSIDCANNFKIPTVVDPRKMNSDYSFYKGASFITPNFNELKNIFPKLLNNDLEIIRACQNLKEKYNIEYIVATRGERGISLYKNEKFYFNFKATPQEIYDVSGAGDTVVAVLAACLLLNIDLKKSMKLANLCAGYVISLRGTKPITLNYFKKFLKFL